MCSGAARKLSRGGKVPVVIVGADGRPRWHELWEGLPYIVKRTYGKAIIRLMNGGGVRPYIVRKTPERWVWKPYKPIPAEIMFTKAETAFAEPYRGMVMIEPNVKNIGHDNKAWIETRWRELTARLTVWSGQCVADVTQAGLPGASLIVTPTFRHALAVLSVARAFIGTEGGLMHGAAAVGTPAVILWSEFISPEITGYHTDKIINLRHAGPPCGMRTNCPGCRKSMEAITVDEVVESLERLLK
jgi:hypothetical protein